MKRSKSLSDIHQDQIEAMSPGSGASTHASDLATMRRARCFGTSLVTAAVTCPKSAHPLLTLVRGQVTREHG